MPAKQGMSDLHLTLLTGDLRSHPVRGLPTRAFSAGVLRKRPARTQRFAIIAKNATFFDGAEAWFDCNLSKTGRFAANMHFVNVPDCEHNHAVI